MQPDLLRVWENRRQLLVLELQCKAAELLTHHGAASAVAVASVSMTFAHADEEWCLTIKRRGH